MAGNSHAEFPRAARGSVAYKGAKGWKLAAKNALGKLFATWTPQTATSGTDKTPVAGTRFTAGVVIPHTCDLTGISFLVGSVGGTDKVIAEMHKADGTLLATTTMAGTTVGSAAGYQRVPFTAGVVGEPGVHYISLSFNGTTARFRTIPVGELLTKSATGTFGTQATLTVPTTFTADVGPIASTY